VGVGQLQRSHQLVGPVDLRDADARPEPRRLDEHRVGEPLLDQTPDPRVVRRLPVDGEDDEVRHPQAGVTEDGLAGVLVHGQGRPEDARADVRQAEHLAQALHGAVLAEGPVQHREHDVERADGGRQVAPGGHEGLAVPRVEERPPV
jgi:hypothetical protein